MNKNKKEFFMNTSIISEPFFQLMLAVMAFVLLAAIASAIWFFVLWRRAKKATPPKRRQAEFIEERNGVEYVFLDEVSYPVSNMVQSYPTNIHFGTVNTLQGVVNVYYNSNPIQIVDDR